jgi:phage terminase Nu1 subunit (DNA packaging protein)
MTNTSPTVPAREVAKHFRVSVRTISDWVRKGCPHHETPRGTAFVLAEVIAWRIAGEVESAAARAPRPAAIELEVEQARKARADADLKELELAERRGALVPIEDFRLELETVLGRMRAVVSGQLHQFERRIVHATTPAEARMLTRDMEDAICRGGMALADDFLEHA